MFIRISQVIKNSYSGGIYLESCVSELADEVLLEVNHPPELLPQPERLDREEENDDDLVAEAPSVPPAKNLH